MTSAVKPAAPQDKAPQDKYVPKHRQDPARRTSRVAVRTMFVLSSAAVLGTGVAVGGGVLTLGAASAGSAGGAAGSDADGTKAFAAAARITTLGGSAQTAAADSGAEPAQIAATVGRRDSQAQVEATREDVERRSVPVSRSDRRGAADPRKETTLALEPGTNAMTRTEDASDDDPRDIAATLLGDSAQFGCLDSLWTKESGWRINADNPSSSAYGIPQALPGSKMSSYGADWATNPVTQIRWGLNYIEDRYGSPCGAWSHSQGYGWY